MNAAESGSCCQCRVRWSGWELGCAAGSLISGLFSCLISLFTLDALCCQCDISVTFVHEKLHFVDNLSFHGKVTQIRPFFMFVIYTKSYLVQEVYL